MTRDKIRLKSIRREHPIGDKYELSVIDFESLAASLGLEISDDNRNKYHHRLQDIFRVYLHHCANEPELPASEAIKFLKEVNRLSSELNNLIGAYLKESDKVREAVLTSYHVSRSDEEDLALTDVQYRAARAEKNASDAIETFKNNWVKIPRSGPTTSDPLDSFIINLAQFSHECGISPYAYYNARMDDRHTPFVDFVDKAITILGEEVPDGYRDRAESSVRRLKPKIDLKIGN